MKSKPDLIRLISAAFPAIAQRDLYRLQTDELAGLMAAARSKWTVEKVRNIWNFSPSPGVAAPVKAADAGLPFISRRDFA